MKLMFRVDASHQIGGGHVMRCLTLAHGAKKRGYKAVFVCRDLDGNMNALIEASFPLVTLPKPQRDFTPSINDPKHAAWLAVPWEEDAEQTKSILDLQAPDWLILDHYSLDARWSAHVEAPKTLVMDDLGDRPLMADLLLDQTHLEPISYPRSVRRKLSGPKYALLRDEFSKPQGSPKNNSKQRILIAPGLMDSYDLSSLALAALSGLDVEIDIATGENAPALPRLRAQSPENLTLHTPAQDMASLIEAADLAIAAGGMSAWERCAFGLPSVIVSVAENQRHVCEGLSKAGACTHIPGEPAPSPADLRAACRKLLDDPKRLQDMVHEARNLCDGNGTVRVLDILEAKLRPLAPDDRDLIFAWRDQPHIRSSSSNTDPLDPSKHAAWFDKALQGKGAFHRIYQEGGRDLGFIGAVKGDDGWVWSFYIGAQNAPDGAGRRMLVSFLDLFFSQQIPTQLKATVLPGNAASLHLHKSLGFTQDQSTATSEIGFTLSRHDWEHSKTP